MGLTSRQRFVNALTGGEVDRAPVASPTSIVTVGLQEQADAWFPEAHHDAATMARLALAGHGVCGYDTVFPVFGAGTHEAAALGVPVKWGDRTSLPAVAGHIWQHPDDIEIPEDLLERPAMRVVLEAIRMLRDEVGDEVAVIGKIFGPWTLAYHTFGLQEFLKNTIKDPAKVEAILRRLMAIGIVFGKAQLEAGADALTLGDHITADLIRPEAYPRFLLDIHREMNQAIPGPLIFHCCGRTLDRIEHFSRSGMACFHFDSANDAFEIKAKSTMALAGNVNNIATLLGGGPDDVRREVFHALDAGVEIIAPECAVPVEARLENVIAVRQAVDEYYRRH